MLGPPHRPRVMDLGQGQQFGEELLHPRHLRDPIDEAVAGVEDADHRPGAGDEGVGTEVGEQLFRGLSAHLAEDRESGTGDRGRTGAQHPLRPGLRRLQ